MAKKKKQSRKKSQPQASERSAFWPLAGSILMFVFAMFLLLGAFGTGGKLPKELYHGAYWTLGWAALFTPVALIFFGVHKFTSEDRQIPLDKFISMLGFLALTSAWLHVGFVQKDNFNGEFVNGHGGEVGGVIGNAALNALDKMPASILFFVLALLAFFLTFSISPKIILKLNGVFKRSDEDTDLATLKTNVREHEFELNEGVPVEHHTDRADRDSTRLTTLKNTAQKLAPAQNHEALTTASDPDWQFPSINLLNQKQDKANAGDVEGNAEAIKETFDNFNIVVDMEGANIGPRVTQYTLKPPTGVKLTKITALENNLSLDLAAHSIRIEAPIPGKRLVGIEVPNIKPAMVRISSLLLSREWQEMSSPLGFVIGKDIAGVPIVADLAKMPHLLVAGQTGSGKSVMINTILTSLLYRNSPSDLKLILVDPKQVELKPYDDIPHLLTPVITEPEKCISALKWTVAEMERRYRALSEVHRRNIVEYNNLKKEEGMPYIVLVIDELADLMMMAARDVEALIVRIAQKARAVGIHLVLATQRPSVDVITGLIKANVPARIAFTTVSQVDSRTIIDGIGAEKLLGQGDMLLTTADMPKPKRVQGAFIDDHETLKVTDFIRMQRPAQYDDEVVSQPVQLNGRGGVVADYGANDANDDMWQDAVRVVIEGHKASTSLLQRRLRVGYARAARLIETMEEQGIVGPADGARSREVLVSSMDEVFGGTSAVEPDMYDENFPDDQVK
ncbi:DNA translocase FtsK 4TM domain-containing protein [Candidatus Saccharibacteria bacterium]|nr:DNA translocase FtsK 4TM domain-containing protein [Candidatus Saccharibacteria bacterium]MBI3337826.1 DNA translocase FtsK 4TM domain-containing protein [Candidatus Saccharibacteria bacterium]